MRAHGQPPEGNKKPEGNRRSFMPKRKPVPGTIGEWNEDLLPPESRDQWKQVLRMRRTCLLWAYRHVSWDSREDVWQEVKISMWNRLKKGPVNDLPRYLFTTCRNEAIDHLRIAKGRAELFIGDNFEKLENTAPVFDERTDARIKELVNSFRPELTMHEARIFVLRAGLRWRIRTVAEALDISVDAVKSAYYSANKKLAQPEIQQTVFKRLNPE